MPASYHIEECANVVISKAWGHLDDSALLEHQQRLMSDHLFKPELNQLFDFTEVTEVNLTLDGVRAFAARNPFGEGSKRAFVIEPGELLMFGMMRMFGSLTEQFPDELRVQFNHIDEARAWLNISEERAVN